MFHVGNARSALFNCVLARQSGGTMVLRVEDTDAARNRPEWVQGILDAIEWVSARMSTRGRCSSPTTPSTRSSDVSEPWLACEPHSTA